MSLPKWAQTAKATREAAKDQPFELMGSDEVLNFLFSAQKTQERFEKALEIALEALDKIKVPRCIETDASGSLEEFEELSDFWHLSSSEKLNLAIEAIAKIEALGEEKL